MTSISLTTGNYQVNAGAGQAYAGVPSAISTVNKDGTAQTFYGCYMVHKVNTAADQPWFISKGLIQQDSSGASISTLLQRGATMCANNF